MRAGGGAAPPLRCQAVALGAGARRAEDGVSPTGAKEQRDEDRVEGRGSVVDPVRGGEGRHEGPVRAGHRPLRRAAAGRAGRSGRLAQAGPVPRGQRPAGLDRRRRRRADHRLRLQRRRRDRLHDDGPRLGQRHLPGRRLPHPAARARGGRRLGAVPADGGRPHRRAGAPARRQAAVRAVPRAHRVVDAVAHDPRRRSLRVRPRRRQPVPAPLGLRPRRQAGRSRPAWSTSRTGTATPSATTARGAARTRRRWSPRSSRPWSGSCRG